MAKMVWIAYEPLSKDVIGAFSTQEKFEAFRDSEYGKDTGIQVTALEVDAVLPDPTGVIVDARDKGLT